MRIATALLAALSLACLPMAVHAYTAAQLAADAAAFLGAESLMHLDLGSVAAAARETQPHMASGADSADLGLDLSLGLMLSPAYAYQAAIGSTGPFAPLAFPADGAGASLAAPQLGGSLRLPGGLGLDLDASFLPAFDSGGATKSLWRVGLSGSWRLLPERFYSLGVLVQGGAVWTGGTDSHPVATDFIDGVTPTTFAGKLDGQWNCGILELGLFVHKTFFVVNFYSRADLCLVLGSSTTTLSDITVGGSAVAAAEASYTAMASGPRAGMVLSGGMELVLGELKLAAEAGRDWLTGALYGTVGLRWGM